MRTLARRDVWNFLRLPGWGVYDNLSASLGGSDQTARFVSKREAETSRPYRRCVIVPDGTGNEEVVMTVAVFESLREQAPTVHTGRQRRAEPVTNRVRRDGKFFRLGESKFYVK